MTGNVENHLRQSAETTMKLLGQVDTIEEIVRLWSNALRCGCKVLFCGNGGSAADCQHLAGELAGRFQMERQPLPALSLASDTAILTAVGNDYGFEHVFERLVAAHGRHGDILVAISTSGQSGNIIRAVEKAKEMGLKVVAFTGECGRLKDMADVALCVPSSSTPRIQEAYMVAGHVICGLVEDSLFHGSGSTGEEA